ncbi:MAG: DUF4392 domain-containing protein [Theionarchaea archaeon]|nr:DUF4392 domain-containing protein [Theionarchaea archaeon]
MIEDIILSHDKRGVSTLKHDVPPQFCERASRFLYDNADRVIIVTGFYVQDHCETDGPVGALMLAQALESLGSDVQLVTDRYCFEVFTTMNISFPVHEFPITGITCSEKITEHILSSVDPSVIVSIERCGRAHDGNYYNMKGIDISRYTAQIDSLFTFPKTVGIGDGGNEIGMGNVWDSVKRKIPCGEIIASTVKTTHLVLSSVSNWGAYGMITYLSRIAGEDLLVPEEPILARVVKAGAIDSYSKRPVLQVDGYGEEVTHSIISQLHDELFL